MTQLSAIVITKNEEKNIEACLSTLTFCDEIIVVDSKSADKTRELARKFTDKIFIREFDHFAAQKNDALSHASYPWVLSLDADERVSEELKTEICEHLKKRPRPFHAYAIPRKNILFGTHLRYGANKGDRPIRLFQKEGVLFEGIIHERLKIFGTIGFLKCPILHYSTNTVYEYVYKLDHYTRLEAELLHKDGIKANLCNLILKPMVRFIQRYFFQWGVLDGRVGFIFSILSSFYDFLRYAKLWEMQKNGTLVRNQRSVIGRCDGESNQIIKI